MNKLEDKNFTHSLYASIFIHMVAVIILYFGLPQLKEELQKEQQVVTFEMLPASSIPNIKNQDIKQKGRVEENSKKIKQSKESTQTSNSNQNEKKTTEKTKPQKKIQDKTLASKNDESSKIPLKQNTTDQKETNKTEEQKKLVKKDIEKPKETNTTKNNAKSSSKVEKKISKKIEDPLDTLMKNLENASQGETAKSQFRAVDANKSDDSRFSRGQIYDENSPLSVTEMLIVKRQIEQQWQPPIGAENIEDVRVLLHIKLNKDGHIEELYVKNVICPSFIITTCKLVEESAIRAVKKSNPLENLPPERYDTWKEFNLYFDPSLIAQ